MLGRGPGTGLSNAIVTLDGKTVHLSLGGVKTWAEIEQDRQEGRHLSLPGVSDEWLEFVKEKGEVPPLLGAAPGIYPLAPMLSLGIPRHGKLRYDQTGAGMFEAYFDQTDQEEISKALIYMRKVDRIYLKFLRERIPGFEDAYIIRTSPTVGTRESRRIAGEYTLTEEDCVEGRRFADVIAKCGHACNVHSVTGIWDGHYWLEPKKPFDIPYRCLIPKKIENLLVAGRTISVTHIAHGATRNEPPCMSTGEAAGTAAALSARLKVPPRNLDVTLLQKKLLEQGVLLFLDDEKAKEKEVRAYSVTI